MKLSTADLYLSLFAMMPFTILSYVDATPDRDTDQIAVRQRGTAIRRLEENFDSKKDKKTNKFEKDSKAEKKSKKSKVDSYNDDFGDDMFNDDYFFSDEFWEGQCFFNHYLDDDLDDKGYGFTNMDGAGVCIENFAKSTYLNINTEDALDCSESLEKTTWEAYPSCYELSYYTPYICQELFQHFDEAYQCFYEWLWGPDCYLDEYDGSQLLEGCVTGFANYFDLDVEGILDCSLDFYGVLEEKCYYSEESPVACDIFQQCEIVNWGADYCTWYSNITLGDVAIIVEEATEIDNFLETVYDGSVDLVEALRVLHDYNGWPNAMEWSEFVECITWELSWSIDDFCEWEFYHDGFGGCVENFVDSFEWLDANDVLTCAVDVWDVVGEVCYSNDTNMDVCDTFYQCGDTLFMVDECASYVPGLGLSDLREEFGDIFSGIYDGTVDFGDAYNSLIAYNGTLSEAEGWDDFVGCLPDINYDDDLNDYMFDDRINDYYSY